MSEIATTHRREVKRVLSGEGMLRPTRDFTWRGQRYRAASTRVSPDAEVCFSEHAHLLTPAFKEESGHRILAFLERVRGGRGRRQTRRSREGPPWRLNSDRPVAPWRL
jgi:hypothetical protein